ncbi:winged helix-turn-helix transcriptional regulator [Candidatus Kaiserbacteria bacterium]|nr:winged helix-turn-helix transcriptional regulator [Candidatus Kaiserbacteria bacterium]
MAKKDFDLKMNERLSLFKLLADRNRYRCVVLLMRSKTGGSVRTIAEALNMSHSSTSHLLAVLHDAGIVMYKKSGREVSYSLAKTPQAKRVIKLVQAS